MLLAKTKVCPVITANHKGPHSFNSALLLHSSPVQVRRIKKKLWDVLEGQPQV